LAQLLLALSPPKYQGKKWKITGINFELVQNPTNPVELSFLNSIQLVLNQKMKIFNPTNPKSQKNNNGIEF
jgi:hypothetical protein